MRNYDSAGRCARAEIGELVPLKIIERRPIFRPHHDSPHARAAIELRRPAPMPIACNNAVICTWRRSVEGRLVCAWESGTPPALSVDLADFTPAEKAVTSRPLFSPALVNLTLQLTKVLLAAAALGLAASHQAHAAMLAYGAL
jgi:hypothetical protein